MAVITRVFHVPCDYIRTISNTGGDITDVSINGAGAHEIGRTAAVIKRSFMRWDLSDINEIVGDTLIVVPAILMPNPKNSSFFSVSQVNATIYSLALDPETSVGADLMATDIFTASNYGTFISNFANISALNVTAQTNLGAALASNVFYAMIAYGDEEDTTTRNCVVAMPTAVNFGPALEIRLTYTESRTFVQVNADLTGSIDETDVVTEGTVASAATTGTTDSTCGIIEFDLSTLPAGAVVEEGELVFVVDDHAAGTATRFRRIGTGAITFSNAGSATIMVVLSSGGLTLWRTSTGKYSFSLNAASLSDIGSAAGSTYVVATEIDGTDALWEINGSTSLPQLTLIYSVVPTVEEPETAVTVSTVPDDSGWSDNVPLDQRAKFKGNVTQLSLSNITATSVDWRFYREFDASPHFSFRVQGNSVVGSHPVGNILSAAVNEIAVVLDRSFDWYVSYNDGSGWSDRVLLELKPRSFLGKHRKETIVTETSRGARVVTNNPLWTETKTARGVTIINKTYQNP